MADDDGLKAETGLQIKLAQRLMMEQTLEVANRMVASMEELHAQFPSDDLREALRNTIGWRDRLRDWLERDSAAPTVRHDKPTCVIAVDDKTPLDPSIPILAHQAACARASLRIIIRPRLTTFDVGVHAISTTQVDLVCPVAIEASTTIAISWDYGPPQSWRTIRATAADTARATDGRSVVTCVFDEPLQPADVEAMLMGDRRPA